MFSILYDVFTHCSWVLYDAFCILVEVWRGAATLPTELLQFSLQPTPVGGLVGAGEVERWPIPDQTASYQ